MITEDKITEIFCIVDDFCNFYDALMAKYTFKALKKRNYHRAGRMSKAEVMMIMILFHSSGYRCLKHFYTDKIYKHMRHLFPEVIMKRENVNIVNGVKRMTDLFGHSENLITLSRILGTNTLYTLLLSRGRPRKHRLFLQ